MQIVKRNGELQEFNPEKIEKVISKALLETKEQGNAKELSQIVCKMIREGITVEQIQDLVFDTLVKNNLVITAREFERYRTRRTVLREQKLDKEIERFLDYGDDENSNKKTDVANVKRDLVAGEYFRKRREKMLPKDLLEAHRKKAIYQHDFDQWEKLTNCFARETEFITDKGVKSFYDFCEGDKIRVLTHKGRYKNATVRHYGKQLLYKITIQKMRSNFTYYATRNHRWILSDGKVTSNVQIGDLLYKTDNYFDNFNIDFATHRQKELWVRGFTLGDGCVSIVDGKPYTRIRLCGHKKEKAYIFESLGYKVNKQNYTKIDYLVHIAGDKKTIPYDMLQSEDDILAYVSGYLYADGNKGGRGTNHSNKLRTQYDGIYAKDIENQNFIKKYFPVAGVYITKIYDLTNKITNFGKRKGNPRHFNIITNLTKHLPNYVIKIKNIEETTRYEDVWCLEVEDDHSFVFPSGVCTGNCCILNIKDMLMNGTWITNAVINQPNSVQTAFNIVSQIFLSTANQEFGGISSHNINETLSFFAKKNFRKNFIEVYRLIHNISNASLDETILKLEDDYGIIDSGNKQLDKIYEREFTEAKNKTRKDIYDACQIFEYQINSISCQS